MENVLNQMFVIVILDGLETDVEKVNSYDSNYCNYIILLIN